jgi:hypothetical protein
MSKCTETCTAYCSLTNTAAIPIPLPMLMLVTKTVAPYCLSSRCSSTSQSASHHGQLQHSISGKIRSTEKGTLTTTRWVPDSNRTAIHVHSVLIQSQRLYAIQCLTRERLVNLPKVDIVLCAFSSKRGMAYAGSTSIMRGGTPTTYFLMHGEAKTARDGASCKEDSRCTIEDLGMHCLNIELAKECRCKASRTNTYQHVYIHPS